MAEDEYQGLKDDGFVTIAVLIDGYQGAVNGYVDYYGLTFPALNDEKYEASVAIGAGGATVPYYVLVGRDMTVRYSGGSPAPASAVSEALAEPWPEDGVWPQQPVPDENEAEMGDLSYTNGNPFFVSPGSLYESPTTCSSAPSTRTPAAALALLALVPLLAWRRR